VVIDNMETSDITNEYLTFTLNEETYAFEVSGIESILEYTKLTKLPGTDDSVKGVLNLRGRALPVMDLRGVLGLRENKVTDNTSIIVLSVIKNRKLINIGGIVDSVKEVLEILPEMIQEAPKIGSKINSHFISGIAQKDDNFIIILNLFKILDDDINKVYEKAITDKDESEEGITNFN